MIIVFTAQTFSHSCVGVASPVHQLKNAHDAYEYRKCADRLNDKVKNLITKKNLISHYKTMLIKQAGSSFSCTL
jgi:hypothetical protein